MKSWEKELRAAQTSDAAVAFAAKQHIEWTEFTRNVASARMLKFYKTHKAHFEVQTLKEKVVKCVNTKIGPVREVTSHYKATRGKMINRERTVEFGRSAVMHINTYKTTMLSLEFTHEILLTNAQRVWIEEMMLGHNVGVILHCIRRKDTGATAICIRDDLKYITLFEDGSTTITNRVPEFGVGSWFFNKKVKREFKAPENAAAGRFDVSRQVFCLQRSAPAKKV